jgi:hypothetical protein
MILFGGGYKAFLCFGKGSFVSSLVFESKLSTLAWKTKAFH